MPWWLWTLLGLVLLILEVHTFGGFYLMFFGLGALLVGLLAAIDVAQADWLQWLLFSVLSVLAVVFLRRPIMLKLAPSVSDRVDSLVGETAIAAEDIPAGSIGKAELRGTLWSARNAGATPLRHGTRGRVERIDGLTLWVRAE
jgi:inner membrane protein